MKKHPDLSRKLELLYSLQLDPAVRSHADLARTLGVTRQSVSRWCRGTGTSAGNRIPHYQLGQVATRFKVEANWFSLPVGDFEQRVRNRLERQERAWPGPAVQVSTSAMPITGTELFGREQELETLDRCWREPDVNVVQLIAFGGAGKSSLVNRWLSTLKKDNYRNAARVFAWSFCPAAEPGVSDSPGDSFMEYALEWFGDREPGSGSSRGRAGRLAKLIRAAPALLILDGLENLQSGPGPEVGQVRDLAVALLIRDLAVDNNGLCFVTSRLPVTDLDGYRDGRAATINLAHLGPEASARLLGSRGIHGNPKLIGKAARKYAGHPLSLSLLAGYIRTVHRGHISGYREFGSLVEGQDENSHSRTLARQYLDWLTGSAALELLYLIGLFDRTVTLNDIRLLVRARPIEGLTIKLRQLLLYQWGCPLKQLEDTGLISVHDPGGEVRIDCHPLVRDFVAEHLQRERQQLWRAGNAAIFQILQESAVPCHTGENNLEPLFRMVIHGAKASNYEEAFALYFNRIKKRFTLLPNGSHSLDRTCIKVFFEKEWTQPARGLTVDSQFRLLSSASANLMSLGLINEAIEPSLKSIEYFVRQGRWSDAVNVAGPLVAMFIEAGRLLEATRLIEEMQVCRWQTVNPVIHAMGLSLQAYIFFLGGCQGMAGELFLKAETVLNRADPGSVVEFPIVSSFYCRFLLNTGDGRGALERALRTFAWRRQNTWQMAVDTKTLLATDLLVLGLIFLKLGDRVNARVQLDRQVALLRAADEWLYLPAGLNSRARLHIATENFTEASRDLREALEISRHTGARFGEWEACIGMARLHFARNDYQSSRDYLDQAMKLPGMGDYRFRDLEIKELDSNLSHFLAAGNHCNASSTLAN